MKIAFEVTLDEKDSPLYILRSSSLLIAMAQALRDEAYNRGNVISGEGSMLAIGTESIKIVKIEHGYPQ